MMNRKIPAFANESEEAQWWFDHRAETATDLVDASRKGQLGPGSVGRRARKLKELLNGNFVQDDLIAKFAHMTPKHVSWQNMEVVSDEKNAIFIKFEVSEFYEPIDEHCAKHYEELPACA